MQTQINWDSFATYNQDARGIRFKFEDLCRQLFVNENLPGNKRNRYLHANPNNSGLEVEPIYDEVNQRWIGFQAKYFDNKVDYTQIMHSAEKTVENYLGKVNHVFLFCNKPITSTAPRYVAIEKYLNSNNITIELVTDTAILDLVRRYPYLGLYYFGNHTIQQDWFISQAENMFCQLGERFSQDFNVDTAYSDDLSLFAHDDNAIKKLNNKKSSLIKDIDSLRVNYNYNDELPYLTALRDAISMLADTDAQTILDAFGWFDTIESQVASFLNDLESKRQSILQKNDELHSILDSEAPQEDKEDASQKIHDNREEIYRIEELLSLSKHLIITDFEQALLSRDILIICGDAGVGKTQLLAWEANYLLQQNRACLFLISGIYYNDNPIEDQIMRNLHLDFSIYELIDILETIGENNNQIVPIFIDALNETWNKRLWKIGLPSIIEKVSKSPMVKLIVSYRTEYEKLLLADEMIHRREKGDFVTIVHRGFHDNSIDAIKQFMDYYNIPFSPLEYFSYRMENPLFLKLYCKTYNGEEVDLPTLYERVIEQANKSIYKLLEPTLRDKGYTEEDNFLEPLITLIASYFVSHNEYSIPKDELMKLSYWSETDLTAVIIIKRLAQEQILYDMNYDGVERFYFAYDQMNDYYCAKAILKKYENKEDVRRYLLEDVLGIVGGNLTKSWNTSHFINACALYADKYGEECIDIIDNLEDDYDKLYVFSEYIKSFEWRNSAHLPADKLYEYLKTYPCRTTDLFSMLIGNSVKEAHPLNADYLHSFLMGYELNRRDCLWTLFINQLSSYDSDRLVQLIEMYNRGEKLEALSERQTELLLTLLSWVLTSSDRRLRDYASKAMVEILKENFDLCQIILEKFITVNDPYVIQRLYGVVFGACCKRKEGDLQTLAEYVYLNVFAKEKVYPDILLRDYAREIIELFLYENPDYCGLICHEKISPPYNSEPIPDIEDQHYLERDYNGTWGTSWLISSMCFEGMGMYGDFGRYVFQSALHHFDVDEKTIFNYALYHIFNNLGYQEELFGKFDRDCGGHGRSETIKTERIGKKYQWITMYYILALVADHCKMIDRWHWPEKQEVHFEGAWDPCVRDFDPTLNQHFMTCDEAPKFKILDEHVAIGQDENKSADISSPEAQKSWVESECSFFNTLKNTLILDGNSSQWICFTKYCDTGRKNIDTEKVQVWSWLYAYFMTPEQAEEFKISSDKRLSVITDDSLLHYSIYTAYNREYPWAPSCKELAETAWVDASIKTGEKETVVEKDLFPTMSIIEEIIKKYQGQQDDKDDSVFEELIGLEQKSVLENNDISMEPEINDDGVTKERDVEKEIGRILHATTDLVWEEQYDASKENTISISVPCGMIIEKMGLKQHEADGFYYDSDGKLAAFDTDLTQKINSVVVRKDILDEFLAITGMKLTWLVQAEKEVYINTHTLAMWGHWEGVYIYNGDRVLGDIRWLYNQYSTEYKYLEERTDPNNHKE